MSASIHWTGLDELREELRNLPETLAHEASGIVQKAAADTAQEVRAAYQAHRHTGNLAEHVTVDTTSVGHFGTAMRVTSTAKHAHIFEIGTQARHTSLGANRGSMPPGKVFIPAAVRNRRNMYERLKDMLTRHGAKVSGNAG